MDFDKLLKQILVAIIRIVLDFLDDAQLNDSVGK